MRRRRSRPSVWLALLVLPLLAACQDKKTPTAQGPVASDLRVRQESGGFAGAPTRFSLILAFADPDADVATMEVKRQDTGEVTSLDLPDATGKTVGLAEGTFEFTAAAPGNVNMTVALVDAKQQRSDDLPFVIGIQQPPPPPSDEEQTEELRRKPPSRSLVPLGARVRRR